MKRVRFGFSMVLALLVTTTPAVAQGPWVVSGNEAKIDLASGKPRLVDNAEPGSLTLLDFSQFPPQVTHIPNVENTVIGPPSNIAVTADGRRALLANSLVIERNATPDPWKPSRELLWLDLTKAPQKIVLSSVNVGQQPSGLSLYPDGTRALVANRADGTVSLVAIENDQLSLLATHVVGQAEDSVSDVAISPDGKLALVSLQKAGMLAVLELQRDDFHVLEHRVSTCGEPYRVVMTPDGDFGLTAGQGAAINGIDADSLTVVDLRQRPVRTVQHVTVGAVPESIEISADGKWVAVVLMAGSNFPPTDERHSDHGELVLLAREGASFRVVQRHRVGRIPEGVAFTSDGKYLLVQCHPDESIWIFRMTADGATDTGARIKTPGMPSSLRASS